MMAVECAVRRSGGHASRGGSYAAHEGEVHRLEDIITWVGMNELMLLMTTCRDNARHKQNKTNLKEKQKNMNK